MLSYYKALIALKKSPEYKETFTYGRFVPDYEEKEGVFAFHRISADAAGNGAELKEAAKGGKQDILVAANYGTEACTLDLDGRTGKVLLSNVGEEKTRSEEIRTEGTITLQSCESAVVML